VGADNASGERQNKKPDQNLSELKTKITPRPTPVRPNSIHRVQEQQQPSPHHTNQPTNQEPNQKFNQPTKPIKKN